MMPAPSRVRLSQQQKNSLVPASAIGRLARSTTKLGDVASRELAIAVVDGLADDLHPRTLRANLGELQAASSTSHA